MEENKTNLILGLDISTSCIGISIVNAVDDNVEIIEITHVSPKLKKGVTGIEALIQRKTIFEDEFLSKINQHLGKYKGHKISHCIIEAPLTYALGNSSFKTVSVLLQFNALLSESVYNVLGIIPHYMSSYEARMYSFPQLMGIHKLNKKGEKHTIKHIENLIKKNSLVLFGDFSYDCDKKMIMLSLISEKFPEIKWMYDNNGKMKKENYDACDSLICCLGLINKLKNGDIDSKIVDYTIDKNKKTLEMTIRTWGEDDTRIYNI